MSIQEPSPSFLCCRSSQMPPPYLAVSPCPQLLVFVLSLPRPPAQAQALPVPSADLAMFSMLFFALPFYFQAAMQAQQVLSWAACDPDAAFPMGSCSQ